jgi:hypothetical protein
MSWVSGFGGFEMSLRNLLYSSLQKEALSQKLVAHACNLAVWEAEDCSLRQPGQNVLKTSF